MNAHLLFLLGITISTCALGYEEQQKANKFVQYHKEINLLKKNLPVTTQNYIAAKSTEYADNIEKTKALQTFTKLSLALHQSFYLSQRINTVKHFPLAERVQILKDNAFYFLNPQIRRDKQVLQEFFLLLNTIPESAKTSEDIRISLLKSFFSPLPIEQIEQEKLLEQTNCIAAINTLTSPILRAFVRRLIEKSYLMPSSKKSRLSIECQKLAGRLTDFFAQKPTTKEKEAFLNAFLQCPNNEKTALLKNFGALSNGSLSKQFLNTICLWSKELSEKDAIEALENFLFFWLNLVPVHNIQDCLKSLEEAKLSSNVHASALRILLPSLLTNTETKTALFKNILTLSPADQKELLAYAALLDSGDDITSNNFPETYAELCNTLKQMKTQ